jgi:hypothetical protein
MCPLRWFAGPVLAALWLGWPGAGPGPAVAQPQGECGLSIRDWCPSPPGDPCGRHKNERECRADLACVGLRYRGESVAACQPDGRGFWSNCPTVGCLSRSPAGSPAR